MLAYEGYAEYLDGHFEINKELKDQLKEHEKVKIIVFKEETKTNRDMIRFLKNQKPWSDKEILENM